MHQKCRSSYTDRALRKCHWSYIVKMCTNNACLSTTEGIVDVISRAFTAVFAWGEGGADVAVITRRARCKLWVTPALRPRRAELGAAATHQLQDPELAGAGLQAAELPQPQRVCIPVAQHKLAGIVEFH